MRYTVALLFAFLFSLPLAAQLDPRERYGTYLGGSLAETRPACYPSCPATTGGATNLGMKVVVDSAGNVFVAGYTNAIDFPTTVGAYRRTVNFTCDHSGNCGSEDNYVAKFSPAGTLIWSTYLGTFGLTGIPVDGLSLDSTGNVLVIGHGLRDQCGFVSFILKLNPAGSAIVYSNTLTDNCNGGLPLFGAASDKSGRYVFLVGQDAGGTLQPTPGANPPDPVDPTYRLIQVDTLKTSGQGIAYIAGVSAPSGVTVDGLGNAFVISGNTQVTKFNYIGAALFSVNYLPSWAESLSGSQITTTAGGDVIFAGTVSPQGAFPATASFGTPVGGSLTSDAIIVRLNGTTGSRIYSIVIHDPAMVPDGIATNSANEAFVAGRMWPSTSLRVNPYSNAPLYGAFLVRAKANGSALWLDSTFGGTGGYAVAVDSAWNAWLVGNATGKDYFPLTSNAFQSNFKNAGFQSFVSKLIIEADAKMLIQGASPNPVTHGSNLTYTLAVYNIGPDVSDGDTITDVLPAGTTFVSYSTTNGTCTHPAVGSWGTFKCTRSTALNKGSYWGPVKLTVHVNAAAGTTLKDAASVAAKTQDVFPSNNSATVYVKVQ